MTPLYERVLGADWQRLPQPVRALHEVSGRHEFAGMARVANGASLLARLGRWMFGFPDAAQQVPVRVIITRQGERELWRRQFGSQGFQSVMSAALPEAAGLIHERFGPLRFLMHMPVTPQGLGMDMRRACFLGIPLPAVFTPRSDTREYVDEQGRFCFDVAISLPFAGLLLRYQGWLLPAQ